MKKGGRYQGFSLIEMMFVLGIIAVLLTISVSSLYQFTGSAQLTSTGDQIVSHLIQAGQEAIRDNANTEVRIYRPPSDWKTGERGWVLLTVREEQDGTHRAFSPPYFLPEGMILSESKELSTLVAGLDVKTDQEKLIGGEGAAPGTYTGFLFYSNGSTNLQATSGGDTWHLTVIDWNTGDGTSSEPPSNFYTIRVDPLTGSVRTFRP